MKLPYFLEPAYDELLGSIEQNLDHYMNNEEWLSAFFNERNYTKESTIEVHRPALIQMDIASDDALKSQEDLANVRLVYESFKLTPLQATNRFLWTHLSHVCYKDYVHHRWLTLPTDAPVRTVKTRYFATGNANSLYDNAIARLWWYGHISYDEENTINPWHLTQILLMNQTICSDFVDTRYCHNRTIGKGVLLALKEFAAMLGPREGITDYFREFNKYFNRYGAVSSLDFLDSEDIYQIAIDYLVKIRKEKLESRSR